MQFDPSAARARVEQLWQLGAEFGKERNAFHIYLNEIVSDRLNFLNGLQVLRDELQFAPYERRPPDVHACGADFSVPSVCTTLATTSCGDRIHQGETSDNYRRTVATRFAAMSEIGELKMEDFAPAGGGTDDGATLAHVTVAHQLDLTLRKRLYAGHPQSFVLVAIDLKTHVGRLNPEAGGYVFGRTRESDYREPRAACGAIVGALTHFNPQNAVHVRVRRDLGEANFAYLSQSPRLADDGTDVTFAIAAAIVSVRGLVATAQALTTELDERGVGHLTAMTTVNLPHTPDTLLYNARATVFGGEVRVQGLGLDAAKYTASMVPHYGERRLLLTYDGHAEGKYPVERWEYPVQFWHEQPVDDDPI